MSQFLCVPLFLHPAVGIEHSTVEMCDHTVREREGGGQKLCTTVSKSYESSNSLVLSTFHNSNFEENYKYRTL